MRSLVAALGVAVLSLAGAGCSAEQPAAPPPLPPADPGPYRLAPGDVVEIKSYADRTLNDTVTVGPDGRIGHILAGYLPAAGRTLEELDRDLTAALADSVRDPRITLTVTQYTSNVAYVGGEVFGPRQVALTSESSVLRAIVAAGGYTPEGDLARVILIRRGPDGTPITRSLDLAALATGEGDPAADPPLRPFDVVIVPPTWITRANRTVDQYVRRMLPGSLGASYSYTQGVQQQVIQ